MRSILERFPKSEFRIVLFGSHTILHKPVEEWPVVDCVVCFHSSGFPLHKAEEYVRLRRPLQVNDVESQRVLLDRRTVYQVLEENNIPTPRHVVMNREGDTPSVLEEHEDFILVNGARINKPFVEKPVDADDHNVYIYYPVSAGGGSKRLFRKVGNRASSFHPGVNEVRRDASYIYEEFLPTQGTDVKVWRWRSCCDVRRAPLSAAERRCFCGAGVHCGPQLCARGGAQVARGGRRGAA